MARYQMQEPEGFRVFKVGPRAWVVARLLTDASGLRGFEFVVVDGRPYIYTKRAQAIGDATTQQLSLENSALRQRVAELEGRLAS